MVLFDLKAAVFVRDPAAADGPSRVTPLQALALLSGAQELPDGPPDTSECARALISAITSEGSEAQLEALRGVLPLLVGMGQSAADEQRRKERCTAWLEDELLPRVLAVVELTRTDGEPLEAVARRVAELEDVRAYEAVRARTPTAVRYWVDESASLLAARAMATAASSEAATTACALVERVVGAVWLELENVRELAGCAPDCVPAARDARAEGMRTRLGLSDEQAGQGLSELLRNMPA